MNIFPVVSASSPAHSASVFEREIEAILDQARWAPSSENTQPWRFEIVDDDHLIVHLQSAQVLFPGCLYDTKDQLLTFLAGGTLLETIRIAASRHGRSLTWTLGEEENGIYPITVVLHKSQNIVPDPLILFVPARSVNRRAYRTTPLTQTQKKALTEALGEEFGIVWHESFAERWQATALNARATDIRLRIPESFAVNRHVIDWEHDFSPTGIPARAVGLDRITLLLTRWLMRDWRCLDFMNRYGGGTLLARLELDVIPGLLCSAHFVICFKEKFKNSTPESIIRAGQAIQRFWLTAAAHNLVMQPSFAPIAFAVHGQNEHPFTEDPSMVAQAARMNLRLAAYAGMNIEKIIFMGRIGVPHGHQIIARSTRRPLEALYIQTEKSHA